MALTFRTMDAIRDRDDFVQFRKNAACASFGEEDPFDEQAYADLIEARTRKFPDSCSWCRVTLFSLGISNVFATCPGRLFSITWVIL